MDRMCIFWRVCRYLKRIFGFSAKSKSESSSIFVLNKDCFDAIFDWLSIEDVCSLGQTCKQMQQIAGEHFRSNYSAIEINGGASNLHAMTRRYKKISHFKQFIKSVSHHNGRSHYDELRSISYIELNCDRFASLNRLCFSHVALSKAKIERIKPILGRIETLRLRDCRFEGDFYDDFLRLCTNLKQLHVQDIDFKKLKFRIENIVYIVSYPSDNSEYKWLQQKYPLLEHFELTPKKNDRITELKTFFQQNPNLSSFSTNSKFFCANQNLFMETDAKLDSLIVTEGNRQSEHLEQFYNGLNELYVRGFYRKLHLFVQNYVQSSLDSDVLRCALEKLYIDAWQFPSFYENLPFLSGLNISELGIIDTLNFNYMKILAENLRNLERMYLANATFDDILAFCRYAPNLKRIKIQHFSNEFIASDEMLDVRFLNRERQKLDGANKMVIFVMEQLYLKTKRTLGRTNFDLVELKRVESCEWFDHFAL